MVEAINGINEAHMGMLVGVVLGSLFLLVLILAVVLENRRKMAQTRERERSRREIAAYVAEGTISADDAAKLLAEKKTWAQALSEA